MSRADYQRKAHSLFLDPDTVWCQDVDCQPWATDRYVLLNLRETDVLPAWKDSPVDGCWKVKRSGPPTAVTPAVHIGKRVIASLLGSQPTDGDAWTPLTVTSWAATAVAGDNPVHHRLLVREFDSEPVIVNSDLLYRWTDAFRDGLRLEQVTDRSTHSVVRVSLRHMYRDASYAEQEVWCVAGYVQAATQHNGLPPLPKLSGFTWTRDQSPEFVAGP